MRISIIYTSNRPLKAYLDAHSALKEHERLNQRELNEDLYYSVIEMPIEDSPPNKPVEPTADISRHCACKDGDWNKYCPIHGHG